MRVARRTAGDLHELQAELRRMEERLKVSIKKEIWLSSPQSGGAGPAGGEDRTPGEQAGQDEDDSQEVVKYAQDDRPWECAPKAAWMRSCSSERRCSAARDGLHRALIALNLAMQAVFIHVVSTAFTSSAYTSSRSISCARGKKNVAHDITHMDSVTRKSLALRVCEKDSGLATSGSRSPSSRCRRTPTAGSAPSAARSASYAGASPSRRINRCLTWRTRSRACRAATAPSSRGGDVVRVGAASTARVAPVFVARVPFAFAPLLLGYGITFIINTVGIGDLCSRRRA